MNRARFAAQVNELPGFQGVKGGTLQHSKIIELLGPPWIVQLEKLNNDARFTGGWRFGP